MLEKYIEICELLDCLGQFHPRLDIVQKMVQQPDFHYDKFACPEFLTNTLMVSSYWLDRELFDETYLYKKENQNLLPMQQAHLKMVDIGVLLLDKGFPLKYDAENFLQNDPHQLGGYAKVFVEQCHKRHDFLHKKVIHKNKNLISLNRQKTLE